MCITTSKLKLTNHFIIPLRSTPKWNLRIGLVRQSVRPSVCPGSDLRNYWMDFLDTWYDGRPISRDDARHFLFLKKFKMADLCPFLCRNRTFWLVTLQSLQLGHPNFQRCCNMVMPYPQYLFRDVTLFSRSQEVIYIWNFSLWTRFQRRVRPRLIKLKHMNFLGNALTL